MAKSVDALASKTSRPKAGAGATPARSVPLYKLPDSVRRSLRDSKKRIEQAAYERRYHARAILFGKGGGLIRNLSQEDRRYVRFVWEEAYQAYLHMFRTGDSRYNCWQKRRQLVVAMMREEPMSRKAHYNQWRRSQKARYFRFDLPRKLKDA